MGKNPAHVWVVSTGEYADFRISAIFSSSARAHRHADDVRRRGDDSVYVERWSLDPAEPERRRR